MDVLAQLDALWARTHPWHHTFIFEVEDPALRRMALAVGENAEQLLAERAAFVHENKHRLFADIRLPSSMSPFLTKLAAQPGAFETYWRDRFALDVASEPALRPGAAALEGLWPGELEEFAACLELAPEALTPAQCWAIATNAILLSADYLRYHAPALADAAPGIVRGDEQRWAATDDLVNALIKGWPLPQPARIAAGLRRGLAARERWTRGNRPGSAPVDRSWLRPSWQAVEVGANLGFARLLMLILELDGASTENLALVASDEPAIAMTVTEHDWGILEGGWQCTRADVASWHDIDAILARLQRRASSHNVDVSQLAQHVLGFT